MIILLLSTDSFQISCPLARLSSNVRKAIVSHSYVDTLFGIPTICGKIGRWFTIALLTSMWFSPTIKPYVSPILPGKGGKNHPQPGVILGFTS